MYKLLIIIDKIIHDRELFFFRLQNIRALFSIGSIPSDSRGLIIGPPRSANTFALRLIRTVWPQVKFTTHLHSNAAMYAAQRLGIKIIYLDRQIDDAVLSLLLKRHLSTKKLKAYYNFYYHRYSRQRDLAYSLEGVEKFSFDQLTSDPKSFIIKVAQVYDLKLPDHLDVLISHVRTSHFDDNRKTNERTFPDDAKMNMKKNLRRQLK